MWHNSCNPALLSNPVDAPPLAASTHPQDLDECLQAGMDDFVLKPTRPCDMAEVVGKCRLLLTGNPVVQPSSRWGLEEHAAAGRRAAAAAAAAARGRRRKSNVQ